MTNHAGNTVEDVLFTPWGDVLTATGTGGYSFAKMPYDDLKTNTDLTTARVFGPNFGRWFTPDPIGKKAVKLDDPQTWNMYAYVRNNPTTLTDPTGLYELNDSGCGGDPKCQKKWDKAAARFEKRRESDLNSKKDDVRKAAAAFGAKGGVNGVHVGFADLARLGFNGGVDPSGSAPGNINVQVTLDFGRAGSEETQTHEGTHVADDLAFLQSYNRTWGTYDTNLSITHGETELNAFRAGAEVNHEHGFGPNETQKIWDYIRANYPARLLPMPVFDPNNFPTGPND
jgi:RHS repeat-associated protein